MDEQAARQALKEIEYQAYAAADAIKKFGKAVREILEANPELQEDDSDPGE